MITWSCKIFHDLTPQELYAIMRLRNEVFVVEQNCVYQDADNRDPQCWHFMGWEEDRLVAYTRLLPPGLVYPQISIGRVVTSPSARKKGLGRELMERSIAQCRELFGDGVIRIGAQSYLINFYTSLGFTISSEPYLEDGIEHVEMKKPATV